MTTADFTQGLRELADWIDRNADHVEKHIKLPDDLGRLLDYCIEPDELADHVRVLGGRAEKGGDDNYFQVIRRFGPVSVVVYTAREKVCRKVTRTEVREVEITEWECEPILGPTLQAVES